MQWKKRGKIFDPTNHLLSFDCTEFAQSPQALVCEKFIRIFFSTRKKDAMGKYLSYIAFVDFDLELERVVNYSTQPVIELGELGCFDEHGIFPFSPVRVGDEIWAYTCGWSRRVSVSIETSTGLAKSHDDGITFRNIGLGPVMTSSLYEPMLVGDSFVRVFEGSFHMWYIFGKHWLPAQDNEPPARVYKIAYASSPDGINWKNQEGKQIIFDASNSLWKIEKWKKDCEGVHLQNYSVPQQGAFILEL